MAAAAVAVAGEEEKTGVTVLHTHTAETAIRYTELRTCSLALSNLFSGLHWDDDSNEVWRLYIIAN